LASPLGQYRANTLLVSLEACDEVLLKALHSVCKKTRAVKEVADHNGLEDIELKVTLRSTESGRDMVAKNLRADHSQRLALGWVDLSWHNGRSRFILGKLELTKTTSRTRAKETNVLSDLEKGGGKGVELAVCLDNGIVSSQSLELVGGSCELMAGHLADLGRNILCEANKSVDSCSDRSSTLSQHLQAGQTRLYPFNAKVELLHIARKLLAQRQWCSILQVCPANLDQVLPLVALPLQGVSQALEGGEERLFEVEDSGDVHDGREGVVGGRRHVDVVVRVDGLLAAHGAAENLDRAVRDDLVGVHVGLCAGTGLPYDEREVVDELERGHLLSSLLDRLSELWVCFLSAA
jgi:hypothetical protein